MLSAAATYGLLVEATFDVYRKTLYEALRLPLPANPEDEYEQGKKLTAYLLEGSRETEPAFTNKE